MSEFLEERFPIMVRLGANYEDEYNVEVTRTAGGREFRRLVHPIPQRRFKVRFVRSNMDLYREIEALYHRAYGRYAGFRVKAINDSSTNGQTSPPTHLDQTLIRVSAGVYQLIKAYGTSATGLPTVGYPYRTLYKPVAGTVKVGVGGVAQPTGWTVDTTTGKITFAVDPGAGAMVTGGCEFDIPCRFDSNLTVTPISPSWSETEEIDLLELIAL